MSRINSLLLLILLGLLVWLRADSVVTARKTPAQKVLITQVPTATPTPAFPPTHILIPKIGVDAPIEAVGVDFEGKMELPEALDKVGWYNSGFKPGEKGNAVMGGHLDTVTGEPAIFYQLSALEPGDEILVTNQAGAVMTFTVNDKQSYDYNNVPISEIFGDANEQRLNLITCSGWFDTTNHNYTQRIVIRSTLTR